MYFVQNLASIAVRSIEERARGGKKETGRSQETIRREPKRID